MIGFDIASSTLESLIAREWLVTNGIGGFASSTVPALNTRKYHGLLVAAMTPPVRQMVLLARVEEVVHHDGQAWALGCSEYPDTIHPRGYELLRAFSTDPFPRWGYQHDGWTIEKSLQLLRGENTVCISYTLQGADKPIDLELRPMMALRGIHELTYQWNGQLQVQTTDQTQHHLPATTRTPEVFFSHDGHFQASGIWYLNNIYRREEQRGYSGLEDLWTAGIIRWRLEPGQTVHFACSADPVDLDRVISEADRQSIAVAVPGASGSVPDDALQSLGRAAEQFIVQTRDASTAVMAGYPWAAPGGRDAMICLPGLLLVKGKLDAARSLLATFAGFVDRGLMPSDFPIDASAPHYTAADTSLWFINAVFQYLRYGGDGKFVEQKLFEVIDRILGSYRRGTALGIIADAEGLLVSRQENVATSWMDARVGRSLITPRQGRPVELNALWYNALRIGGLLAERFGHGARAAELNQLAQRAKIAFNAHFWNEAAGCCFDVVDDTSRDASIRPNQILALSLPYSVLGIERHASVIEVVRDKLLTCVGLRTISSDSPEYRPRYAGDAAQREMAYHQGTVFPWLLGPFITALLRVQGRGDSSRAEARFLLQGCIDQLMDAGNGQLCELFDGDAPHAQGGLTASARSVAEIFRAYVEDVLDLAPAPWQDDPRAGAEPITHPVRIIHT